MSAIKLTLLIAGSAAAIVGTIFLIRSRKQKRLILYKEKFIKSRNSSFLGLSGLYSRLGQVASSKEDVAGMHPEGPNIGYNSDSSWFGQKRSTDRADIISNMKAEKLVVALVGLPNSGKTYIARKISRYLRWISYRTRAFSIAKYRLDRVGTKSADYFDPSSISSYQQRISVMTDALDDALRYLERGGDVAIIDGTNVSKDRRQIIREKVRALEGCELLWIESCSERGDITDREFEELKNSPDFLDKEDYIKKMALYKANYQQVEEEEGSFIKVFDDGQKLILHEIHGFLRTKIVSFVMNLHRVPRPVYLVRHGESAFNERGLIGGGE